MEHTAATALKRSPGNAERSETPVGNTGTNVGSGRAYLVKSMIMVPVTLEHTIVGPDTIEGAQEAVKSALANPIATATQGVRCWEQAGKPELVAVHDAVTGERIFVPPV